MAKSANINIRIEPSVKNNVETLYSQFGITISDAINMFLHQSLLVGGLPFDLKKPRYNSITEKSIEEAKAIKDGKISAKSYSSFSEVLEDLDD